MSDKTPRQGNLSSYTTGRIKKRLVGPANPPQNSFNDLAQANYNPSKFVQRSPRENIGTPGTSKFVQRDFTNSSSLINKPRVLRKRPVGPTK